MVTKPRRTTADFLAMAVCPGLIMLFVGGLVFFLLQVGYAGEWLARLQWTLFWFVFAMVLVSRIALEQSPAAALLYGAALAGATSLLLMQYIGFLWQVWGLIALIWWATHQLTVDCTLIDEDQDASGEGLVQRSVRAAWTERLLSKVKAVTPTQEVEPVPHPRRAPTAKRRTRPQKRAQNVHAPGLWILYFSLAAVPIFGLGELLVAKEDVGGRRWGLLFLVVYLVAGFVLLLLTSFLGLRRYLRQRYLQMPPQLAMAWISRGIGLALVILMVALLLPRPATSYSVAAFVTKLTTPEREDGQSNASAQGQEGADAGNTSRDQAREDGGQGRAEKGAERSGTRGRAGARGQPGTASAMGVEQQAIRLERWLSFLVLFVIIGLILYWFWTPIVNGFRTAWRSLASLFAHWFRRKPKPQEPNLTLDGGKPVPLLPDPFQTGRAGQMSLPELIRYSFDGLRRWGLARGFVLDETRTPLEFGESLSQKEPAMAAEILLVSSYFSHVSYSPEPPPEDCVVVLKRLWAVIGFNRGR